jgi:hypothetical protein
MSEVIVLKPGFLRQGDQVEYVLSGNENPLVGIVIASSIPAVKFISFDVNYHNHFAKFQTATSNKKGKCLFKNWDRATNKWVACNAELSWVTCNLRDHIKGVHKDLVPYKDLDQHYTDIISAEFCGIREDRNVPIVHQVPVFTATNILTSFKKQRKDIPASC